MCTGQNKKSTAIQTQQWFRSRRRDHSRCAAIDINSSAKVAYPGVRPGGTEGTREKSERERARQKKKKKRKKNQNGGRWSKGIIAFQGRGVRCTQEKKCRQEMHHKRRPLRRATRANERRKGDAHCTCGREEINNFFAERCSQLH